MHFSLSTTGALRAVTIGFFIALFALGGPVAAQQRLGPFTQPPRSVRSRSIDQQHVRLEFRFDWDQQKVQAKAIHTLALIAPQSTLELDAAEMQIMQATLALDEGHQQPQKLTHRQQGNQLAIELGRELPAGQKLQLAIEYTIEKPRHGFHFVVPDESEPNQPRMIWTQSEPEFARYWFPCFDAPNDRLTSEIIATVPKDYEVLSNGTLESRTPAGDGQVTWHWHQAQSHVPYLLSVVAGDFDILEQSWDGIPVLSYVPTGRLADAPRSFEKTPAMLKFFSEKIGVRYPWPKYAQICVDEYGWGGMEHTSATTLNLGTLHDERAHHDVSSINLVAHELAHQWWGNLMTCKDWGELWLNESFATYFATLWTEHDEGWDEAAWERRNEAESYFGEDARYRRSIVNYRYDNPINMFDRHSYPKGSRVLHMLRYELGDEAFWRAIRRYGEFNRHRVVETADLRIAIEDATGQGMNWFFDQWVHRGGHPEFNVAWDWDAESKQVRVVVKQTQKVDEVTPLFRTSAEIELGYSTSNAAMKRVKITKAEETFHFESPERPTRVCFDPQDWILKKLVFDKSKEELLDQLASDKHASARVQALAGLASLKDQADVIAAVARALESDPFWGVRQEAAKVLGKANTDAARQALVKAAQGDVKSFVRRDAISALGNFAHDDSRAVVREVIAKDPSYFAVAEALRTLLKIDRDKCREALLAAVKQPSHDEVILRAACDGLIELKDASVAEQLSGMLSESLTPQRRVAIVAALARLKPQDAAARALLEKQLDNDRVQVRRAAIDALAALGDDASIAALQTRRGKEEVPRMVTAIDEAIGKLRERGKSHEELRKELDELRKKNQELEQRLQNVEKKGTAGS
ncbi:MAG TPA: M1 family aminopeptidase [Pirellulaceae bacterium]|nr:M1 family aminopeptidase [Pirellulaceae bacterium]